MTTEPVVRAARRPMRSWCSLVTSIWLAAHGAASVAASGPAAPAVPIVITDDRGVEQRFARPPTRIVSLLPSITETVCALGACERLVGIDRYSDVPAVVRSLPKLGGLDDAQVERIVALKPDVVLAGKSARVTDRLESLGLTVVLLESQTHADVKRSLATIAHLLGVPEAGERLWSSIERDLAAAAARVPVDVRGKRVYFEVDATPYAAGAGSFVGETLARLGMANVAPAALGAFPRLNAEFVVRSDPDIIVAAERELATMRGRPGWDQLTAIRRQRVCAFAPARYTLLVRPGPRLGEAALALAGCLATLPR